MTLHATEGVTALPRFIAGLQLGRVGLGLGLNYFRSYYSTEFDSERNTAFSMFEIGPSVSVRILEGGPDRRAQLHLLLSLVLGAGTATAGEPDDPDVVSSSIAGLGGSFGAFARVMVLSSLALDVGMVADVLLRGGLSPELGTPPEVPEDDWRPKYGFTTLQLLGFVGVTVIL